MDEKNATKMNDVEDAGPWKSIRVFVMMILGLAALDVSFFCRSLSIQATARMGSSNGAD